jgi:hypothetical protein
MTSAKVPTQKLFTPDQANAMLPLVRAIASDLSSLYIDLVERQQRLDHLTSGRQRGANDVYSDELRHMEDELERDKQKLRDLVDELQQLGVQCKDPARGLIDFPCAMDGRTVLLCWKLDEPEVLFWHELDAGFAGRQPLTAGSLASGDRSFEAN